MLENLLTVEMANTSDERILKGHKIRLGRNKLTTEQFRVSLFQHAVVLSFFSAQNAQSVSTIQILVVEHFKKEIALATGKAFFESTSEPSVKALYKALNMAYAKFPMTDPLKAKVTVPTNLLVDSLLKIDTIIPAHLVNQVMREAKFDRFKAEFQQHRSSQQKLNETALLRIMTAVDITENEIVSAYHFEEWFEENLSSEHESDPLMDWKGLVLTLVKSEVFTVPQSILPNSNLGLMVLCGQLMQQNIPRGPYHDWSKIPCFASDENGTARSKAELLVQTIISEAEALHIDQIYLAKNFRYIVNSMDWLIHCKDETKNTPFGLALSLFENLFETHIQEQQKQERLAEAEKQKQALLKRLEDINKRAKEEVECDGCKDTFTFYYPDGEQPPYQGKATGLDFNRLCPVCQDFVCLSCKENYLVNKKAEKLKICDECQLTICLDCKGELTDTDSFLRKTCSVCSEIHSCNNCKAFIPRGVLSRKNKWCATCAVKCCVCFGPLSHDMEIIHVICTQCAKAHALYEDEI